MMPGILARQAAGAWKLTWWSRRGAPTSVASRSVGLIFIRPCRRSLPLLPITTGAARVHGKTLVMAMALRRMHLSMVDANIAFWAGGAHTAARTLDALPAPAGRESRTPFGERRAPEAP